MTNNDLLLTKYAIAAKTASKEISDTIRNEGMWNVIEKAKEGEAAFREIRLRAIALGFGVK
jgi:hypothetical protein